VTGGATPGATKREPLLPPVCFVACIVVMVGLDILLPAARVLWFPWTLAGLAPMVIGGALNIAADRAFKRYETTVKPFGGLDQPRDRGCVLAVPQSMYLGMILILLGVALFLGALTPFVLCVVSHALPLRSDRGADASRKLRRGMATLQRTGSTLGLAYGAISRRGSVRLPRR
jgi:hypothetical protein